MQHSSNRWAQVFLTDANPESAYMRINGDMLAKFIFNLFGFTNRRWYLTLNRTNWEFSQIKINFLVLAVVYKGVAVPLMWS